MLKREYIAIKFFPNGMSKVETSRNLTYGRMFTLVTNLINHLAYSAYRAMSSETKYEKFIHDFQTLLSPTSPVWDISEKIKEAGDREHV